MNGAGLRLFIEIIEISDPKTELAVLRRTTSILEQFQYKTLFQGMLKQRSLENEKNLELTTNVTMDLHAC